MSFTLRTIVHTFTNADSTAASGSVTFMLPQRMTNDGQTVLPGSVPFTLDGEGALNATNIAANDDTDTTPTEVQWQVTLSILGSDDETYAITVPSAGSGSINLGTLLPSAQQVN